jgi:hypothetical protein
LGSGPLDLTPPFSAQISGRSAKYFSPHWAKNRIFQALEMAKVDP